MTKLNNEICQLNSDGLDQVAGGYAYFPSRPTPTAAPRAGVILAAPVKFGEESAKLRYTPPTFLKRERTEAASVGGLFHIKSNLRCLSLADFVAKVG